MPLVNRMELDVPLKASTPGERRPQGSVHPERRVCIEDGCSTVLSRYNAATHCWQHEAPHRFVLRTGRRKRTDKHSDVAA
jgi:hypothetical protein